MAMIVVAAALLACHWPISAAIVAAPGLELVWMERKGRRMHCCPIHGCGSRVRMDRLLCYYHWAFVPEPLKRQVYRAWNGGECHDDHAARCAEATAAVQRKMDALRT